MKTLITDNVKIVRESELKGTEIIIVLRLGKAIGVISKDSEGYYGMVDNMKTSKRKSFSDIVNNDDFKYCEFLIAE